MDGIISVFDGLARVFPALEVSMGLLRGSKLLTVLVGQLACIMVLTAVKTSHASCSRGWTSDKQTEEALCC